MMETTETLSLGQQLKNTRESLGLSIEEVAQKTNLKKNHIDAFENDIFILQNVPPAFARGYVRNYVRFLRLAESLIDSVNYGEVTIPKEVKRVAPIKVSSNHKSQKRWVKTFTWLILLAAVGMTLAWWWQEHQKDQASREALVNHSEIPMEVAQNNETAISFNLTPVVENQDVALATQADLSPSREENTMLTNAEPANTEPVAISAPSQVALDPNSDAEVAAVEEKISSESVNILQQQSEQAVPTQVEQDQPAINDELRIEISNGQSWITVRGAKNKRLAEKLYNSGEVLTFNGNEQYRLTVGAPANVKIYYKGEAVPLKVDGRVARFKLPLAN